MPMQNVPGNSEGGGVWGFGVEGVLGLKGFRVLGLGFWGLGLVLG